VAVNRKGEAGAFTDTLDKPIDGIGREWAAPLGCKHKAAVGELPAQLPERPDLVAAERALNRSAKLLRPCDGNGRAISTPPLDGGHESTTMTERQSRNIAASRTSFATPTTLPWRMSTSRRSLDTRAIS
jgi:hypothetical protein